MRSISKRHVILSVLLIAVFAFVITLTNSAPIVYQESSALDGGSAGESIAQTPSDEKIVEYEIKPGDTAVAVLNAQGVREEESLAVMSASKGVFDFAQIQAGKILTFRFVNEALAAVDGPVAARLERDRDPKGLRRA